MGDQQIFLAGMENYKQSFCLADIDPNIEFITHFSAINPIYQHPSALMPLPLDNQYLPESSETFPAGSAIHQDTSPLIHIHHSQRKRKAMEISSSAHSSPQVSDHETRTQNVSLFINFFLLMKLGKFFWRSYIYVIGGIVLIECKKREESETRGEERGEVSGSCPC